MRAPGPATADTDATSNDVSVRRDFLIDTFKTHVDQIKSGQTRRFEILRYTFIGFFAYWAFVLSLDNNALLCSFAFETVVLIPSFLLFQVFLYVQIINRNIDKHGAYLAFLFDNGLSKVGVGPNLYNEFLTIEYFPNRWLERSFSRLNLHYSQVVLLMLAGACVILYFYVERTGGFVRLVSCA